MIHTLNTGADTDAEFSAFEKRVEEILRQEEEPVSEAFRESVLLYIRKEERLEKMWKLVYIGAAFAFAAVFVFFANAFRVEGGQSGLIELLSLFVSDTAFIARQWKDYGYSLLEALPTASATAALGSLFLAVLFLKQVAGTTMHMRSFRARHVSL